MIERNLEQEVKEHTHKRRIVKSIFTCFILSAGVTLGRCGDSSEECYQQLNCYETHQLTSDYTCSKHLSGSNGDLCTTNQEGEKECCSCYCFYSTVAH